MKENETFLHMILSGCMSSIPILLLFCLYKALKGPRHTVRLFCINMIATLTVSFICILSVYLQEGFLIDIALVYAMLSFLAIIVLCRIVTLHHKEYFIYQKRKEKQKYD